MTISWFSYLFIFIYFLIYLFIYSFILKVIFCIISLSVILIFEISLIIFQSLSHLLPAVQFDYSASFPHFLFILKLSPTFFPFSPLFLFSPFLPFLFSPLFFFPFIPLLFISLFSSFFLMTLNSLSQLQVQFSFSFFSVTISPTNQPWQGISASQDPRTKIPKFGNLSRN